MTHGKATVLGINGHIGHHIAKAFVDNGWDVAGFGRSNRHPLAGVRFVAGDADNIEDIRGAIGDSEVVVNALNLPYAEWNKGRMEALYGRVVEAMGKGRTMLFPGNIYNYAATDRLVTPALEQRPETPRGAIRVRSEAILHDAARRGDMQVIILRAGDFYGPESSTDWFDQVILREAGKGRVSTLGGRGVGHAWAYLPDLARAFEVLACERGRLGEFESFHFEGHFVTPEEMTTAVVTAAPVPLKASRFPWVLLSILGLFDPTMREAAKMGYLWQNPMMLRDARLDILLGENFDTPFAEAVAETVRPYFAAAASAAA